MVPIMLCGCRVQQKQSNDEQSGALAAVQEQISTLQEEIATLRSQNDAKDADLKTSVAKVEDLQKRDVTISDELKTTCVTLPQCSVRCGVAPLSDQYSMSYRSVMLSQVLCSIHISW